MCDQLARNVVAGSRLREDRKLKLHFACDRSRSKLEPPFLEDLPAGEIPVTRASWLKYVYLANFSSPRADRHLFRLVKKLRVGKIFELGIADLDRTVQLIAVAARFARSSTVKYAALDEFDARCGTMPSLPLIDAHRQLQATEATVRLLPGDPASTLASAANSHAGTDLILVAPWLTKENLASTWPWVPRMLHDTSVVLGRFGGSEETHAAVLTKADISQLAAHASERRAA